MKPSVSIELDKPRNLRLTTNALVKVEELLCRPLSEIGDSFGIKEIRAILYAGLVHEDKDLTLDAVGDLMDLVSFEYAAEKVGQAIELAIGGKEDKQKGKN